MVGWFLAEPSANLDRPDMIPRVVIRIRSEHQWPEKIVMDTSQPMVPPPSIEVAPVEQLAEWLPEEMKDRAGVGAPPSPDAVARLIDVDRHHARAKRRTPRASPRTHTVRVRNRNQQAALRAGEDCCRFEWESRPEPRAARYKRIARRGSWIGVHFMGPN